MIANMLGFNERPYFEAQEGADQAPNRAGADEQGEGRMIKLKKEELDRVSHAVEKAREEDLREIALAMIPQSDSYAVFELMTAVICGFVWFVALLFWINPIGNWLSGLFWGTGAGSSAYPIVMLYGFSSFLIISVVYAVANIPGDRPPGCSPEIPQREGYRAGPARVPRFPAFTTPVTAPAS